MSETKWDNELPPDVPPPKSDEPPRDNSVPADTRTEAEPIKAKPADGPPPADEKEIRAALNAAADALDAREAEADKLYDALHAALVKLGIPDEALSTVLNVQPAAVRAAIREQNKKTRDSGGNGNGNGNGNGAPTTRVAAPATARTGVPKAAVVAPR